ncbi:DinB family protein [Bacillus sp. NEB1478]|uniref:DinB family protein n=1 Tax=Bacillus sp. NEB1478 TaxID=3073816 RepID=UPI00287382F1|nr:DinB family protein [Bacillus sp. NEB1478]WNB91187.1 DinB family protein [Bacillus sp. NEB1478]
MSDLTLKNFELTRDFFLKNIESMSAEMADIQPEGFNNNIRWHVGHVLVTAEYFMFGYPEKSKALPVDYIQLFNRGTSPADWKGEVPSLQELTTQLKDQLERIKEIPAERFQDQLKQPFFGLNTVGELAVFANYHETYHSGQLHAMKKVIANQTVKQA